MYTHSNDMNFERAQNIKEKIEALENLPVSINCGK